MFQFETITTQAECEELIAFATDEIEDLDFRIQSYTRSLESASSDAENARAELVALNAEIARLEANESILIKEDDLVRNEKQLHKARYQKVDVQKEVKSGSPKAGIKGQLRLFKLQDEKARLEGLLADATARKAQLSA